MDAKSSSRRNKKRLRKGKRKLKPTDKYYIYHQKGHWSNNCPNTSNERKILRKSANLAVNFLNLIDNCKVRKVIIAVVGDIETAGILLNCNAILYIYVTDQAQFILYIRRSLIYILLWIVTTKFL